MFKNGKEALLVAFITGLFGALSVLLKEINTVAAISTFGVTIVIVYIIIWRAISKIKESIGKPETHPVFYTIDYGMKVAFDFLPITHVKKKQLVVLYMKTKMQLVKEALEKTIADDELVKLPGRILEAVACTKYKMSGNAPEIFIEKMTHWDNKYNAWTIDAMGVIIDSVFYGDKNMKYAACFDCVQVMVKSTLVAAENTINELNGELETFLDARHE